MDELLAILQSPKTWISVGITVAVIVIAVVINVLRKRFIKKKEGVRDIRKTTLQVKLFTNILKLSLFVIAIIIILEINGINVSSLVTGIGVVTVIVSFAVQDLLKDVIQGINLAWDKYFKIGDVIEFEGKEWEVIEMSIKATKLKNIDTQDIFTIANREIDKVKVVSQFQNISLPGNYGVAHEKMVEICKEICEEAKTNAWVKNAEYIGTDAFLDSQISYIIRVYSEPTERDEARRFTLGLIQDVLAKEGVAIPFNQLDVHVDK